MTVVVPSTCCAQCDQFMEQCFSVFLLEQAEIFSKHLLGLIPSSNRHFYFQATPKKSTANVSSLSPLRLRFRYVPMIFSSGSFATFMCSVSDATVPLLLFQSFLSSRSWPDLFTAKIWRKLEANDSGLLPNRETSQFDPLEEGK